MADNNPRDNLDGILRHFFAEREAPPPALRSAVSERLREAEQTSVNRVCVLVLAGGALFSAALLMILQIFAGAAWVIAGAVYAVLSLYGGLAIILVCRKNTARRTPDNSY